MADTFKWAHASEWLNEKINGFEVLEFHKLREFALAMAGKLDGDQVQDLFQDDMDEDGFFTPLWQADNAKLVALSPKEIIWILEGSGIEIPAVASTERLLGLLVANLNDGTVPVEDLDAVKEEVTL